MDMFRKVHSIDPDVKLFLNDFDIVLKTSHRTVVSSVTSHKHSLKVENLEIKYVIQLIQLKEKKTAYKHTNVKYKITHVIKMVLDRNHH